MKRLAAMKLPVFQSQPSETCFLGIFFKKHLQLVVLKQWEISRGNVDSQQYTTLTPAGQPPEGLIDAAPTERQSVSTLLESLPS